MWNDGYLDWIVLASGYVLALAFFGWLGGLERAADAFRRWGHSASAPRRK